MANWLFTLPRGTDCCHMYETLAKMNKVIFLVWWAERKATHKFASHHNINCERIF